MLIGRHSFIRQSKLSDVAGRIDYISNPKRQEYLYETYQTEGATPEFWKNLARENQLDFKASGSAGKCIEGREFIIALPESFVQYRAGDVVRLFTETFHKRYKRYLKENKRAVYIILLTSGRLNSYLADIEEQAQERFERIVEKMKQEQGITEQLKAENQMEWVGRMNNVQACARESVEKEIIYV